MKKVARALGPGVSEDRTSKGNTEHVSVHVPFRVTRRLGQECLSQGFYCCEEIR